MCFYVKMNVVYNIKQLIMQKSYIKSRNMCILFYGKKCVNKVGEF